jgi:hypothetical protein
MQLEDEQYELLAKFVEAHRSAPRDQRGEFFATEPAGASQATFVHLYVHSLRFQGSMSDADTLAQFGLLRKSRGSGSTPLFSVLPQGIAAYEKKKRSSPTLETMTSDIQRLLYGIEFRAAHPAAFAKWEQAASKLWAADSPDHYTTIGHLCREALQEFATALARQHNVDVSALEPSKTVARLQAIVAARQAKGTTRGAFLSALIAYWGTVSDLIQRQEHGGQREGEPLGWEDGRCVVFQTCIVMYEISRSLR